MARSARTLPAKSLACLTRRTEGWVAGLRLAAMSMGTHPDPDHFVTELITEDSAVTGYLVEEVLNTQPPQVRYVLLSTSILEHERRIGRRTAGESKPGQSCGFGARERVCPADRVRLVPLPPVVREMLR